MPRMVSGANIPGDDGEGHGVGQTGVGSLDAPGNVLMRSPVVWGADEGVKWGDWLSLDQKLRGQFFPTVPGAVGRGDDTEGFGLCGCAAMSWELDWKACSS